MAYTVEFPTAYFPRSASSKAVGGGFVYIGEVDKDPTVEANRINVTVIQPNGTEATIAPDSQPFTLTAGGLFQYQGSVVQLRVNERYAMTVQLSDTSEEYYFPQVVDELSDSLSLPEIASAPTAVSNTGFVYTKDVAGDTELFYVDDAGNEVQLTDDGVVNSPAASLDVSGTTMLFYMASVPTGWTLNTDNDDAMLVVDNAAGGSSGGTDSPTSVSIDLDHFHATQDFTITEAQLPAHVHPIDIYDTSDFDASVDTIAGNFTRASPTPTEYDSNSAGSGDSINIGNTESTSGLSVDLAFKYATVIIGEKD